MRLLIALVLLFSIDAFAAPQLISKVNFGNEAYKISAELYFDKAVKKPAVWVDYQQGSTSDDRIAFKATSLASRLKEADFKLVAMPLSRLEKSTTLIFDAYDLKTNEFNGNRGIAVLFNYPIDELLQKDIEFFVKNFPNAMVKNSDGKATHIKALIARITFFNVYPVAAFDQDISSEMLPKP